MSTRTHEYTNQFQHHLDRERLPEFRHHGDLVVVGLVHEGFRCFEPLIRQIDVHCPHLDGIGNVLDRTAGEARFGQLDPVQIGADIGNRLDLAMLAFEPLPDRQEPLFLRPSPPGSSSPPWVVPGARRGCAAPGM